jgi:hypothetical protein
MLYVPLGVLAATVTIPLASMLNGPVVNGVTLVLVVVAAMLLNVSFVNAFNALPYCLMQQLPMDRSLHLLDCLLQLCCSGITICWAHSILLMDWLRIMVGDAVRTTWCGCNGYYSVGINAQWSCR